MAGPGQRSQAGMLAFPFIEPFLLGHGAFLVVWCRCYIWQYQVWKKKKRDWVKKGNSAKKENPYMQQMVLNF